MNRKNWLETVFHASQEQQPGHVHWGWLLGFAVIITALLAMGLFSLPPSHPLWYNPSHSPGVVPEDTYYHALQSTHPQAPICRNPGSHQPRG